MEEMTERMSSPMKRLFGIQRRVPDTTLRDARTSNVVKLSFEGSTSARQQLPLMVGRVCARCCALKPRFATRTASSSAMTITTSSVASPNAGSPKSIGCWLYAVLGRRNLPPDPRYRLCRRRPSLDRRSASSSIGRRDTPAYLLHSPVTVSLRYPALPGAPHDPLETADARRPLRSRHHHSTAARRLTQTQHCHALLTEAVRTLGLTPCLSPHITGPEGFDGSPLRAGAAGPRLPTALSRPSRPSVQPPRTGPRWRAAGSTDRGWRQTSHVALPFNLSYIDDCR